MNGEDWFKLCLLPVFTVIFSLLLLREIPPDYYDRAWLTLRVVAPGVFVLVVELVNKHLYGRGMTEAFVESVWGEA